MADRAEFAAAAAAFETILDHLRFVASQFDAAPLHYGHGALDAWDEAIALVAGALRLPFDRLERVLPARLTPAEGARLLELAWRRIDERVPVAYLTGRAVCAGLEFDVDPRVIVPRSPIAELIEQQLAPFVTDPPDRILDLCCGSGALGIACAYAWPDAAVVLADLSAGALEVAGGNVRRHDLIDRVELCRGDLFDAVDGRFDLIVCNPPYVPEGELDTLPPEYGHEPRLALGSGADGLDAPRRVLSGAAAHLTPGGVLVLEVGDRLPAVEEGFAGMEFTWADLARGGDGVLVTTREALLARAQRLAAAARPER
jgi:ribosomal protein L3 glutamine methyltransferase